MQLRNLVGQDLGHEEKVDQLLTKLETLASLKRNNMTGHFEWIDRYESAPSQSVSDLFLVFWFVQ